MEGHLILCVFWVFSNIIEEYSCLKYCIFTKLSQIECLNNVNILVCQHVKCDISNRQLLIHPIILYRLEKIDDFIRGLKRKKSPRPKWIIYKHESEIVVCRLLPFWFSALNLKIQLVKYLNSYSGLNPNAHTDTSEWL